MNDNQKTIELYTELVEKYGNDYRSLNWGSKESQRKRFAVLNDIGELNESSVLDIGCGLADFYGWLTEKGKRVDYNGLDITPAMIEHASVVFPDANFNVGSVLDESISTPQYDYVFASGIFYLRQQNPFQYMTDTITAMYNLCKKGIAFNSLSSWSSNKDGGEFYADPLETINFCRQLSQKIVLRHDYHPNDFTIYIYKN